MEFRTGVKVHVGAARNAGLATRACTANLNWETQELVVTAGASQVDLDAFGVDLGDGSPVAAFQIKKLDSYCCMDYAIYSLQKPPRLLRAITGGGFFSASDVDLDGTVEIFTDDAAAVDGFENLTLGELDSAPTVVFRFARGQLQDVSSEFPGIVFKLVPSGSGWTESNLYNFKGANGDGGNPVAGVILDSVGNLYGTTSKGGLFSNQCLFGCGIVFKLAESGGQWRESVLYKFTGSVDGSNPNSALILDSSGNLYGTATQSGSGGGGTVFEIKP